MGPHRSSHILRNYEYHRAVSLAVLGAEGQPCIAYDVPEGLRIPIRR